MTGGAGFIGSHIAEALVARGEDVTVLDNLCTGDMHNLSEFSDRINFIEGDVADPVAVKSAMQGIEYVFHQAALASVPLSIDRPLDTNHACVTGTLNILNEAHQAGVRRVIYAASSSCYGDQATSAKRESDPLLPMSPYASAKLAGEMYCQAYYHSLGLETVCIRYFNVFGPRQDPDSPYSAVIPIFLTRLLAGKAPVIYGDGNQSRDFTYVANVVQGNLLAVEAKGVAGKVFNIANGKATSLLELLQHLKQLLELEVTPQHEPARPGDVRDSMADITLARTLLGYDPGFDFQEGLRLSIDYYRDLVAKS